MAEFKIVIGDPKSGKSVQKVLAEDVSKSLIGAKIGDAIKGEKIGLTGYEFIVTGGSDDSGFPMRKDAPGTARKQIFAVEGVGLSKIAKGVRQKKRVAGNTVHTKTAQINLKVTKAGKETLFEDKKPDAPEKKE